MPEPITHATATPSNARSWPLRLAIVGGLLLLIGLVYAMGWHRHLTLETLVRHRMAIDGFIGAHYFFALAMFIGVYVAVVSLSIPAALFLTISSGILFGPVIGPLASIASATGGAAIVFTLAKTALGESLVRRAGPAAQKLAAGFRADAFSYLLFLRLAPVFPFWLVNLAPALFGVRLSTFIAATLIGAAPAAFAFGFAGAGLDSVIGAQESAYRACLAAGQAGCRLTFEIADAVTPQLLAAFGALAVIALVPVAVKRWRARRHAKS